MRALGRKDTCFSLVIQLIQLNTFSAGTVFIRQNLTSTDVRFWRIKTVPTLIVFNWLKMTVQWWWFQTHCSEIRAHIKRVGPCPFLWCWSLKRLFLYGLAALVLCLPDLRCQCFVQSPIYIYYLTRWIERGAIPELGHNLESALALLYEGLSGPASYTVTHINSTQYQLTVFESLFYLSHYLFHLRVYYILFTCLLFIFCHFYIYSWLYYSRVLLQ